MINSIILAGRIEEFNDEVLKLSVTRNFKNENGEYEVDIIPCIIKGHIASSVNEYCEKGDLIGIKGRIEGQNGKITVITEEVTFLSSNRNKEEK